MFFLFAFGSINYIKAQKTNKFVMVVLHHGVLDFQLNIGTEKTCRLVDKNLARNEIKPLRINSLKNFHAIPPK